MRKLFLALFSGAVLFVCSPAHSADISRDQAKSYFTKLGFEFKKGQDVKGQENWFAQNADTAGMVQLVGPAKNLDSVFQSYCVGGRGEQGALQAMTALGKGLQYFFPKWDKAGEWLVNAIIKEGDVLTRDGKQVTYAPINSLNCLTLAIRNKS